MKFPKDFLKIFILLLFLTAKLFLLSPNLCAEDTTDQAFQYQKLAEDKQKQSEDALEKAQNDQDPDQAAQDADAAQKAADEAKNAADKAAQLEKPSGETSVQTNLATTEQNNPAQAPTAVPDNPTVAANPIAPPVAGNAENVENNEVQKGVQIGAAAATGAGNVLNQLNQAGVFGQQAAGNVEQSAEGTGVQISGNTAANGAQVINPPQPAAGNPVAQNQAAGNLGSANPAPTNNSQPNNPALGKGGAGGGAVEGGAAGGSENNVSQTTGNLKEPSAATNPIKSPADGKGGASGGAVEGGAGGDNHQPQQAPKPEAPKNEVAKNQQQTDDASKKEEKKQEEPQEDEEEKEGEKEDKHPEKSIDQLRKEFNDQQKQELDAAEKKRYDAELKKDSDQSLIDASGDKSLKGKLYSLQSDTDRLQKNLDDAKKAQAQAQDPNSDWRKRNYDDNYWNSHPEIQAGFDKKVADAETALKSNTSDIQNNNKKLDELKTQVNQDVQELDAATKQKNDLMAQQEIDRKNFKQKLHEIEKWRLFRDKVKGAAAHVSNAIDQVGAVNDDVNALVGKDK